MVTVGVAPSGAFFTVTVSEDGMRVDELFARAPRRRHAALNGGAPEGIDRSASDLKSSVPCLDEESERRLRSRHLQPGRRHAHERVGGRERLERAL